MFCAGAGSAQAPANMISQGASRRIVDMVILRPPAQIATSLPRLACRCNPGMVPAGAARGCREAHAVPQHEVAAFASAEAPMPLDCVARVAGTAAAGAAASQ